MGIVLTATAITASAQKAYTQGVLTLSADMRGQAVVLKDYFTPDSTSYSFTTGPCYYKNTRGCKKHFFRDIS